MKTDIFVQKSSNLFMENRLLKFVVGVVGIAVMVNSFLVYRAVKYQRTVLIPPSMTGTVEFVQGKPTENYIRDLSRRVVSLATTYSPPTARKQFDELLGMYAPESYPSASKSWYSLAGRIEETQVSSVFYMEKLFVGEDTIEMFGDLSQFAGDTQLERASKTYVVSYRIRDGRFEIMEFKEKNMKKESKEEAEDKITQPKKEEKK